MICKSEQGFFLKLVPDAGLQNAGYRLEAPVLSNVFSEPSLNFFSGVCLSGSKGIHPHMS